MFGRFLTLMHLSRFTPPALLGPFLCPLALIAQVLFSDDFSAGNTSEWSVYGGTWTVADEVISGTGGAGIKMVTEQVFSDFTFEADIRTGSPGEAGVIFRVANPAEGTDAFSGYYAGINTKTQTAVLGKMNNDWTMIAMRNIPVTSETPMYYLAQYHDVYDSVFQDRYP